MAVYKLLAIVVCGSLVSCTQTPNYQACPVLVNYSSSFEKQAAQEIQALPPSANIIKMLEDYATLRQEVRDCK